MPVNIYEIKYANGEREWIAGLTKTMAMSAYLSDIGENLRSLDFDGASMERLPVEVLPAYTITDEDGETMQSFAEWLTENKSGIVATTFY